jgi:hypothetical protein
MYGDHLFGFKQKGGVTNMEIEFKELDEDEMKDDMVCMTGRVLTGTFN